MSRTRLKQIVIRMTDEEYETVKKQVAKSGMKQQEYLIKAVTEKPIINTDGVKEIIPELKRIGNNLNQIARRCNEGYEVTHDEVLKQGEEMNEVWLLLRRLVQGLVSPRQ